RGVVIGTSRPLSRVVTGATVIIMTVMDQTGVVEMTTTAAATTTTTLAKDCMKNTTTSTSGQADKKPGASGRVFAITEGQAANTS
nr:hypothetical protein [Tanacetum cinerariifolium]